MTGQEATIDVQVRELNQLFDSMDPSPFHEQDLAASAVQYIVDSVKELRTRATPTLRIHVRAAPDGIEERDVERAIGAHFARRAAHLRRTVRELLRDGLVSLAIGLAFLALFFTIAQALAGALGESAWGTLASESFLIGGWVALWRPLEIFLYAWWPIVRERRLHDRLSRMTVQIAG